MKRLAYFVIALSLFGRPAAAFDVDPAMPVLRMYVAAIAANDCPLVWRLTSSEVKNHGDAPEQFRDLICRIIAKMQATHVQEQLSDPIAHLTDGRRHAVLVVQPDSPPAELKLLPCSGGGGEPVNFVLLGGTGTRRRALDCQ